MKSLFKLKRLVLLLLIPIGVCILIICGCSPDIAEYVFARGIYRVFSMAMGTISGIFGFSLAELVIYLLPAIIIFFIVRFVKRLKNSEDKKNTAGIFLVNILCTLSVIFFMFVLLCGTNYYRESFTKNLGFERTQADINDIYEMSLFMTEKANEARSRLTEENSDGTMKLPYESFRDFADATDRVMHLYCSRYDAIISPITKVKPVFTSKLMSNTRIVGIYFPFTMEANVNNDLVDYNRPTDALHELAHVAGIMREDEANYIAFEAAVTSGMADFEYSGYMMALTYGTNVLYKENTDMYNKVMQNLSEDVLKDYNSDTLYWQKYQGKFSKKIAEISDSINDAYLKANGQEEGVKSYGGVVDLMVGYYKKNR